MDGCARVEGPHNYDSRVTPPGRARLCSSPDCRCRRRERSEHPIPTGNAECGARNRGAWGETRHSRFCRRSSRERSEHPGKADRAFTHHRGSKLEDAHCVRVASLQSGLDGVSPHRTGEQVGAGDVAGTTAAKNGTRGARPSTGHRLLLATRNELNIA
jgi:hypothetical protein